MFSNRALSIAACLAAAVVPAAVQAKSSYGFNLRATVPLHCSVTFQAGLSDAATDNGVTLGSFREYCNAAHGYQLIVTYEPGTLRGAELIAGGDRVVLDGSGTAILSRTTGPRVRERDLAIEVGDAGFDTDRFELDILPS